jgi:hypothetical protein
MPTEPAIFESTGDDRRDLRFLKIQAERQPIPVFDISHTPAYDYIKRLETVNRIELHQRRRNQSIVYMSRLLRERL